MLGAIIGDIIGSVYENNNVKSKDFNLFTKMSSFTDDSILTISLADSIINNKDFTNNLKLYTQKYPNKGYGSNFLIWASSEITKPYNSWGNGSAMRTSPVAWAYNDLEEILEKSKEFASVTHNHPEGIKGAQAISAAIFLAKKNSTKEEIKEYIEFTFGYNLSRTLDEIRKDYKFEVSCQKSVPEAIIAFLESENFEDAIRNAVSLGGDSDTIAAMSGSIAEAYYKGVPKHLYNKALDYLDDDLKTTVLKFQKKYIKFY